MDRDISERASQHLLQSLQVAEGNYGKTKMEHKIRQDEIRPR